MMIRFRHVSIGFIAACTALATTACSGGSDAVVAPPSAAPTTGVYVATQHAASSLTTYGNVAYSTRPNAGGQYTSQRTENTERTQSTLTMRMDIVVPPNATAASRQPLLVFVHGGGFVAGDKSDFYPEVESYARAGYVTATINYRLTRGNGTSDTIRTTAVLHATEDAMNAVRFLRANAARYGIDPTRVVSIGSSAGGAVSLMLGLQPDDTRARSDFTSVSARVNGAVSTGASLQGGDSEIDALITFDRTDSPVLLYHAKETDSGSGRTWTGNVLATQQRINASGNSCTVVPQPNMTHTVELVLGNEYWPPMREFLWTHLRLAELR